MSQAALMFNQIKNKFSLGRSQRFLDEVWFRVETYVASGYDDLTPRSALKLACSDMIDQWDWDRDDEYTDSDVRKNSMLKARSARACIKRNSL